MRFHKQVAIVTGGANGIGRAVALALAREGASLIINDVDVEGSERCALEIRSSGGTAASCLVPVGTEDAAESLVEAALSQYGTLHVLVNVAGVFAPASLHEMTAEMFDRVVRVHLYATFFNIRAAVKHAMMQTRYGRVINTVSRVGLRGALPGQCNYAAAKAGVAGLTLSLAHELMPLGITVNAVSPVAWTRTANSLPPEQAERARHERSRNVLGRVGTPEDVVPLYLFLASTDAAYVTGQIVQATGQPMALL